MDLLSAPKPEELTEILQSMTVGQYSPDEQPKKLSKILALADDYFRQGKSLKSEMYSTDQKTAMQQMHKLLDFIISASEEKVACPKHSTRAQGFKNMLDRAVYYFDSFYEFVSECEEKYTDSVVLDLYVEIKDHISEIVKSESLDSIRDHSRQIKQKYDDFYPLITNPKVYAHGKQIEYDPGLGQHSTGSSSSSGLGFQPSAVIPVPESRGESSCPENILETCAAFQDIDHKIRPDEKSDFVKMSYIFGLIFYARFPNPSPDDEECVNLFLGLMAAAESLIDSLDRKNISKADLATNLSLILGEYFELPSDLKIDPNDYPGTIQRRLFQNFCETKHKIREKQIINEIGHLICFPKLDADTDEVEDPVISILKASDYARDICGTIQKQNMTENCLPIQEILLKLKTMDEDEKDYMIKENCLSIQEIRAKLETIHEDDFDYGHMANRLALMEIVKRIVSKDGKGSDEELKVVLSVLLPYLYKNQRIDGLIKCAGMLNIVRELNDLALLVRSTSFQRVQFEKYFYVYDEADDKADFRSRTCLRKFKDFLDFAILFCASLYQYAIENQIKFEIPRSDLECLRELISLINRMAVAETRSEINNLFDQMQQKGSLLKITSPQVASSMPKAPMEKPFEHMESNYYDKILSDIYVTEDEVRAALYSTEVGDDMPQKILEIFNVAKKDFKLFENAFNANLLVKPRDHLLHECMTDTGKSYLSKMRHVFNFIAAAVIKRNRFNDAGDVRNTEKMNTIVRNAIFYSTCMSAAMSMKCCAVGGSESFTKKMTHFFQYTENHDLFGGMSHGVRNLLFEVDIDAIITICRHFEEKYRAATRGYLRHLDEMPGRDRSGPDRYDIFYWTHYVQARDACPRRKAGASLLLRRFMKDYIGLHNGSGGIKVTLA